MDGYFRRISLYNFVLLAIGIYLTNYVHVRVSLMLIMVFSVMAIVFTFTGNKKTMAISVMCLAVLAGMSQSLKTRGDFLFLQNLIQNINRSNLEITGTIKSVKNLKSSSRIHLTQISVDGVCIRKAELYAYTRSTIEFYTGKKISLSGEFNPFGHGKNPGETDWFRFFLRRHIIGKLFTDDSQIKEYLDEDDPWLMRWGWLHEKIRSAIFKNTSEEVGGLTLALLTGNRNFINPDLSTNFNNSGVIHVLALSGLHVGYITILLVLVARVSRIPWGWDRVVIFLGLFVFILITGFRPSVVRGSMMAAVYLLGPMTASKIDNWNSYGLAGIIILILKPESAFEAGFLYSFLAVGSIFLIFPVLNTQSWYLRAMEIKVPVVRGTVQLFTVSLCAQAGTIPLTLWLFHKFPLAGFFSNIFVIPLIGIFVSISICLLILASLGLPMGILGNSLWLVYTILDYATRITGNTSVSNLYPGELSGHLSAFMVLNLVLILTHVISFRKIRPLFILVTAEALLLLFLARSERDVIFIYVGQGDAILFRTEDQAVLVDTGPVSLSWDAGERVIVPLLRYLGITRLQKIFLTHDHSDHTGGIRSIISSVKVDTVYFNSLDSSRSRVPPFLQEKKIPIARVYEGRIINIGKNIQVETLYPRQEDISERKNKNNHSMVLRSNILKGNLLLSGDLELDGFEIMKKRIENLQTDFYKLSHHGSYTGTSADVLLEVQPKFVVISAGERNKFDHPSKSVLQLLDSMKVSFRRTDLTGAVWLRSNGKLTWEHKWR